MWLKLKKTGVVLLIVIVVILLLSILGGAILMLVSSRYKLTIHQIDRTKAFYLAEAGMHHALWRIRNNEDGSHVAGLNLCSLGVESPPGSENPSATESIDPSLPNWGGGFATAIEIKYIKTEVGSDTSKSSDDKFKIKSKVTY
jgi:type II secretory pathway pseudopilin PulG